MGSPSIEPPYYAAFQHYEAGQLTDVVEACTAILNRTPRDSRTLRLLGLAYCGQGEFDRGGYCLTAALANMAEHEPEAVPTLNELAASYLARDDPAAAVDCYRRALDRRPDDISTLGKCAGALVQRNCHAEAIGVYRAALAIEPALLDFRTHEGIALLAMGQWTAGWPSFEARLRMPRLYPGNRFPQDVPRWRGELNMTVLLQAEQGLGDTLNFVRYVPLVAGRGTRVILRVQQDLGKLLAGFPGADTVLTNYDEAGQIDAWCPLMSLPMIFGTEPATIPSQVPYVRPPVEYPLLWQAILGPHRRPRIGIVWSARQYIPLRSMSLAALAPLLARQDLEFHVLQKDVADADRAWLAGRPNVVDHSSNLKDFADTAAIASLLDMVLTIDTAVAHLAGAMARPVWIMLPFSADWRWLTDRTHTGWYPTARLFRQQRPGDWDGVVAEVMRCLAVRWPERR